MKKYQCAKCGATSNLIRPHIDNPEKTFCKDCKLQDSRPSDGVAKEVLAEEVKQLLEKAGLRVTVHEVSS